MSHTLRFKAEGVLELVEHARSAPGHGKSWRQQEEGTPATPALMFVKDDGIYLMSNGEPPLPGRDGKTANHVVYAEDFDPNVYGAEDMHRRATLAVGGDDFGEYIPIELLRVHVDRLKGGAAWFNIRVTKNRMTITTSGRR